MSRKRYVSTSISTDKRVAQLAQRAGPWAVTLYTWSIPHAGDDGTLVADPEELLSTVAPALAIRSLVTIADVELFIAAALELGLYRCVDGRLKFPEKAFYGYQSYIGAERRNGTETNGWAAHNAARADRREPAQPEQPGLPANGVSAEPRVSPQIAADKKFAPEPPQNPAPVKSSSSLTSSSSFNSERINAFSVRAPTRETGIETSGENGVPPGVAPPPPAPKTRPIAVVEADPQRQCEECEDVLPEDWPSGRRVCDPCGRGRRKKPRAGPEPAETTRPPPSAQRPPGDPE